MKLKRYNKKHPYSYSFGAYTTLDLIKKKNDCVQKVLLKEQAEKSPDVKEVIDLANTEKIPVEVNDRLIDKVAFKENTYVVGVFDKYSSTLEKDKSNVVLINPSSTGNLGTIMRSMHAFNFHNLAIIKPGVDIFNPKTIRASMGSFFSINWQYFDAFEEYYRIFKNNSIFLFTMDTNKSIDDVNLDVLKKVSLVFGNESTGIDESLKKYGEGIYIPQNNNVDSLNLSIAVSIGLYRFRDCG